MCWSLVVCSHVVSVVDATRHTKASWVKILIMQGLNLPTTLRRFALWVGDKIYGMCLMSSDKLTHMTHLSLLALLIGDWNCRSSQSSQWTHCSCWDTPLSLTDIQCINALFLIHHLSDILFYYLKSTQKVFATLKKIHCLAWSMETKESVCLISRVCVCLYIHRVQGVSMCASPGRGNYVYVCSINPLLCSPSRLYQDKLYSQ